MAHQEQPYLERLETEQFWHLLLAACRAVADRAKRWPLSEEDRANVRSARHWVTRVHTEPGADYARQHPQGRAEWLNNQMKHTIMLITKVENIIRRHQREHGEAVEDLGTDWRDTVNVIEQVYVRRGLFNGPLSDEKNEEGRVEGRVVAEAINGWAQPQARSAMESVLRSVAAVVLAIARCGTDVLPEIADLYYLFDYLFDYCRFQPSSAHIEHSLSHMTPRKQRIYSNAANRAHW